MIVVTGFFGAIVAMLIVGVIAAFVIGQFYPVRSARFGALCFVTGFAIARYSGELPLHEVPKAIGYVLGASVGVLVLAYWWFKRPQVVELKNG